MLIFGNDGKKSSFDIGGSSLEIANWTLDFKAKRFFDMAIKSLTNIVYKGKLHFKAWIIFQFRT